MGGIGVTELLIIAAIVVLLFGTKKLRSMGSDLGSAVKGFRKAMDEDPAEAKREKPDETPQKSASSAQNNHQDKE
ncbi:twin-arginine translocase TatA/TatE family subunit [Vibrio gazogenes]|jgi:sec-independent protein translocase protein TatA|uniref:Sec-independent protein translocase protein TatA n=1 Tax=Vibrio gazogenes DSM 21264 = NBRC 103151 TaxID=1123492 RepID=A0A1M5BRD0_VIBGA|nr:twin-arginine translocase TatA/TatE family subunit [Vibrio gazogenes]SHF45114.1 sec-independent protein translocase protein TatA [Vibrio gazogenes DSM 21264] [Vibrio gazogenes DSM 21264 = NBRC 103151]SJN54432.1 Sec-independent protein translocase protein TatA [Vibrio gazogenes]